MQSNTALFTQQERNNQNKYSQIKDPYQVSVHQSYVHLTHTNRVSGVSYCCRLWDLLAIDLSMAVCCPMAQQEQRLQQNLCGRAPFHPRWATDGLWLQREIRNDFSANTLLAMSSYWASIHHQPCHHIGQPYISSHVIISGIHFISCDMANLFITLNQSSDDTVRDEFCNMVAGRLRNDLNPCSSLLIVWDYTDCIINCRYEFCIGLPQPLGLEQKLSVPSASPASSLWPVWKYVANLG